MLRLRTTYAPGLAAAVRGYLGLSQTELGCWLGVRGVQISEVEAGRKRFGPAAAAHLRVLAECLPAALPPLRAAVPPPTAGGAPALAAPMPGVPAPPPGAAPAPLRARLRACMVAATREHTTLAGHHLRTERATRWTAALPALRAAVPLLAPAMQPRATRWLAARTADLADPSLGSTPDPTTAALGALRLALLEAEAATLRQWLGE